MIEKTLSKILTQYKIHMPNKAQLIAEVENVLEKWHKEEMEEQ